MPNTFGTRSMSISRNSARLQYNTCITCCRGDPFAFTLLYHRNMQATQGSTQITTMTTHTDRSTWPLGGSQMRFLLQLQSIAVDLIRDLLEDRTGHHIAIVPAHGWSVHHHDATVLRCIGREIPNERGLIAYAFGLVAPVTRDLRSTCLPRDLEVCCLQVRGCSTVHHALQHAMDDIQSGLRADPSGSSPSVRMRSTTLPLREI